MAIAKQLKANPYRELNVYKNKFVAADFIHMHIGSDKNRLYMKVITNCQQPFLSFFFICGPNTQAIVLKYKFRERTNQFSLDSIGSNTNFEKLTLRF